MSLCVCVQEKREKCECECGDTYECDLVYVDWKGQTTNTAMTRPRGMVCGRHLLSEREATSETARERGLVSCIFREGKATAA